MAPAATAAPGTARAHALGCTGVPRASAPARRPVPCPDHRVGLRRRALGRGAGPLFGFLQPSRPPGLCLLLPCRPRGHPLTSPGPAAAATPGARGRRTGAQVPRSESSGRSVADSGDPPSVAELEEQNARLHAGLAFLLEGRDPKG